MVAGSAVMMKKTCVGVPVNFNSSKGPSLS